MKSQFLVNLWGLREFPSSCGFWAVESAAAGSGIVRCLRSTKSRRVGKCWAKRRQCAGRDAVPLQQTQDLQGTLSKAAGPGQQEPFSATPAHSPALPQAAPGPLVPLQQFCWPMVPSLTFAQLMILADRMGQPRLFSVGSCASGHSEGHSHHPGSPEWTSRATFAEEPGRKKKSMSTVQSKQILAESRPS